MRWLMSSFTSASCSAQMPRPSPPWLKPDSAPKAIASLAPPPWLAVKRSAATTPAPAAPAKNTSTAAEDREVTMTIDAHLGVKTCDKCGKTIRKNQEVFFISDGKIVHSNELLGL